MCQLLYCVLFRIIRAVCRIPECTSTHMSAYFVALESRHHATRHFAEINRRGLGLSVDWPIKKLNICSGSCASFRRHSPWIHSTLCPGTAVQRGATHRSAQRAKKRRATSGLHSSRAAELGCSRAEQLLFPGVCPHFEHCRALSVSLSVVRRRHLFLTRTRSLRPKGPVIGYGFEKYYFIYDRSWPPTITV